MQTFNQATREIMRRHIQATAHSERDLEALPPQDIARIALPTLAKNETLSWELLTDSSESDQAMLAIHHALHQIAAGHGGTTAALETIVKELGSAVLHTYLTGLRDFMDHDYANVRDDVELCEYMATRDQRSIDRSALQDEYNGSL